MHLILHCVITNLWWSKSKNIFAKMTICTVPYHTFPINSQYSNPTCTTTKSVLSHGPTVGPRESETHCYPRRRKKKPFILRGWHLLLWSILPSGPLYFMSPTEDGTAILRGHPSDAKVSPLALQREWLHFSVILRPWVLIRPPGIEPATSRSAVDTLHRLS